MEHVRASLEQEATHATTDEARMVLPGIHAILGFPFIPVFTSASTRSAHCIELTAVERQQKIRRFIEP